MDKTYKRHSFTKLWIATAMFIFCCFATSAFAQEAVDADTFMTTTETITEVKTTPEIAETATASAETTPDTIGELALGLNTVWMLLGKCRAGIFAIGCCLNPCIACVIQLLA